MPSISKQSHKPVAKKSSGSVLDRLDSAWDMIDTLSLLLFGRSGSGKTTLWSTFPKPILAVIVSGGKRPEELKSISRELRKEIKAVVLNDSADFPLLMEQAGDFATVVLDHVTSFQDLILREILGLDELPEQKSWGLASQSQYGVCTTQCKEHLRKLLDLPQFRVIVGQERDYSKKDESNGETDITQPFISVAATPSLAGWLAPACSYVCQTYLRRGTVTKTVKIAGKDKTVSKPGQIEYCLRVAPHEVFASKFRVPKGKQRPECIVDPSYEKIAELIS